MRPRILLVLLTACLLAACEAAPSSGAAPAAADTASATDAVADADASLPDLFLGDTLELQCPGASGCTCSADSDCTSGVCAETPADQRCAVLCGAGCPTGTVCKTFAGSGDPVLYCAPVGVRQCAPCQTSQDCVGAWGAPAVCASAGNAGSFCASVCQVSADCPAGTQCVTVSGTSGKVCAPPEGLQSCTCSAWATAANATTSCLVSSGTQACPGSRSCTAQGLGDCTQLSGEQCFDVGCKDAKDGTPCDDADPCTQSECQAGTCIATDTDLCQCQTSADCPDDADLCNGKPFCDKSQAPYQCKTNPASVVSCPKPTDPCQVATCQPDSGNCLTTTAPDTTPCDDGKACTVGDVCMAGKCVSGTVTCACAADADCTQYEDGNLCNGTLFCNKAKGQCQVNPKTVVVCATGLDTTCEQTVCVPQTGACTLSQAPTSTLCDDGNPCSASDHCKDGQCVSTVDICPCEQDADCASSEDNNLCNGTLYCDLQSNTCKVNPATVVSCPIDSGNPCAPMECQPATGQCQPSPLLAGTCDDANPCTALGACVAGQCVAGPDICQCQNTADCALFDDANPCNGTLYCDAQTGTCKANLADIPVCPPGDDACTANVCDPASGACQLVAAKDGTWCTDGEACTKNDQCAGGACKAGVSVCACLADADCAGQDDGDPCNGWFFCDKTDGAPQCVFNPQPKAGCGDATDASSGDDADAGSTTDADTAPDTDATATDVPDTTDASDSTDTTSEPSCTAGDLLVELDNNGLSQTVCAHDYPAWGALTLQPDNLTNHGDGTVLDSRTGLQWQQEPAGWNGQLQQASLLDHDNAVGYCDDLILGGHHDWYLPTAAELLTLVDYTDASPPVLPALLLSPTNDFYWSLSRVATAPEGEAWQVQSLHGFLGTGTVGTGRLVRCVRQSAPQPPLVAPAARWSTDPLLPQGAVADLLTGLVWQAAPAEPPSDSLIWLDATGYCQGLALGGQAGWRLPDVHELLTLVDREASTPALASPLLGDPSNAKGLFHTQTPMASDSGQHWGVHFDAGASYNLQGEWPAKVRCVRPIACGDGICDPTEPGVCFADCGCTGVSEGGACDDGNPCTEGDVCTDGSCSGTTKDCADNLPNTTGICSPDNGSCYQLWAEICNGQDDDLDGTTDNVSCGGAACACKNGVAVCPTSCTACVDPGDRRLQIDNAGVAEVICAHDYPAWGIASDSPTGYSTYSDSVLDPITGLQWQVNFDQAFKTQSAARSYCNNLVLQGFADWRLPTQTELESIVDYGTANLPPILASAFPGTWQSTYWSETPLLGDPAYAYGVYFALGSSGGSDVGWNNIVARCVRNGTQTEAASAPAQRWLVSETTATDAVTKRVWQRTPATDGNGTFAHAEAIGYCEALAIGGANTWRLPTIRELRSATDFGRTAPQVLTPAVFNPPDTGSWYWSSSQPGSGASTAWAINNYNGNLEAKSKTDANRVLCVRDITCGDKVCEADEATSCFDDCGCPANAAELPLQRWYTYQPMTDLLLVVDNSGSMQEEQQKLGEAATTLLTELSNYGLDYHIGVVTTDLDNQATAGLLRLGGQAPDQTRVVTLSTPVANEVLQDQIAAGVTGSATEAGFGAAFAALQPPLGMDPFGTCNQDADCAAPMTCVWDGDQGTIQRCAGANHPFRRSKAGLDVVFLSDEDDQSQQSPSATYAALLNLAKPSGRGLGIHAIVGPVGGGCSGPEGDGQPGDRYGALVAFAGGVSGDICNSDYSLIVQQIVQSIRARLLRFPLGAPMVPSSLVVEADGVTCPAGSWSYDPATQTVQIDPDGVCGLSWGDGVSISGVVDCSAAP